MSDDLRNLMENENVDNEIIKAIDDLIDTINDLTDEVNKPRRYAGTFMVEDIAVSPSAEYTLQIALDRDDYVQGFLNVHMPNDVSLTTIRRLGAFIQFTTDDNDAVSKSVDKRTYNVYGYNFDAWHLKGYWYEEDGLLSANEFKDHGGYVGTLRIKSCKINGSNIDVVWKNASSSYTAYLTVEGGFQVFR